MKSKIKKNPVRVECMACGYRWATRARTKLLSCPSCCRKTERVLI